MMSPAHIIALLDRQGLFHDEPLHDPRFVRAARRMAARARHHMHDQQELVAVLTALGPWLRIERIEEKLGKPTGGIYVWTTDRRRRWLGQSRHDLVVYAGDYRTGHEVLRIALRPAPAKAAA
jgi:hypothetical protein